MRWPLLFTALFPLIPTRTETQPLNETTPNPLLITPPLATINTICTSAHRAHESHLKQINYLDCLSLLNEILLDPNTNRQNTYDAATAHQAHFHNTCSVTLRSRSQEGSDFFWGYEIAIAAAMVVRGCVQDSGEGYGGVEFVGEKGVFFVEVGGLEGGSAEGGMSGAASSLARNDVLVPSNNVNTTLLSPRPSTAIPVCQITQKRAHILHPITRLDCYHLFYNLLTNPALERIITLRGLSPIPYQTYGTCTVQLRGNSLVAKDRFRFVEVLLAAVRVVQTCVVGGGWGLGGAVGVGGRGGFVVRVFNGIGRG